MSENIGNQMKVHVPNLLKEIMGNPECGVLKIPLLTFKSILIQVATRASELNDTELNKLMMRLALYEVADPESKEYNLKFVNEYLNKDVEKFNTTVEKLYTTKDVKQVFTVDDELEKLETRLKELRISNNFTQDYIAEKLGTSVRQYRRYENGETILNVLPLIELSKIYNVSTDYILGLKEN